MLFQHVAIAGLAHIDAPRRLTSDEIHARLKPTMDRLGIKTNVLQDVAGVNERRLWDGDMLPSDAATLAGVKALADAGIDADRIGLLVNTSVSRDYLEPSTASIVSGNLRLGENCQNFDIANACLAFLNGMDIASRMIERGEIDYALVVDGETANLAYEKTMERLSLDSVTAEQFRDEMATLTLGSGAAAMVMARAELVPGAPRYRGSVTRSATEWNHLCRGDVAHDRMVADGRMLMIEGVKLGQKTFAAARTGAGLGGRGARRVRHPPGQQGAHPGLPQGLRHQPEEGHDHLRRARQHRPGLGADRVEQAARDGPPEEGHPRRPARHRLGPELLDGRSRLVRRPRHFIEGPVRPALFIAVPFLRCPFE